MSLLNQMLKDLDKRQGSIAPSLANNVQSPVGKTARSAPKLLMTVAWVGLAAVAIGLVVVYWPRPAQAPPATEVARVSQAVPPPVQPKPAVVSSAPAAAAPAPAPAHVAAVSAVRPASAPMTPMTPVTVKPAKAESLPTEITLKTDLKPAEPPVSGSVSRVVTAEQRADNTYREAIQLIRVGRSADAQQMLQDVLREFPAQQDARQLLARVMLENGQNLQAVALLTEGVAMTPQNRSLYVALANAQIQASDIDAAISTLETGLSQVGDNADYHAMLGALLQQKGRHDAAVQHYVLALRQTPDNANWLVGLGVSLQALNNRAAAIEAYQRAMDLGLPSSLSQFTRDRLRQLGQ